MNYSKLSLIMILTLSLSVQVHAVSSNKCNPIVLDMELSSAEMMARNFVEIAEGMEGEQKKAIYIAAGTTFPLLAGVSTGFLALSSAWLTAGTATPSVLLVISSLSTMPDTANYNSSQGFIRALREITDRRLGQGIKEYAQLTDDAIADVDAAIQHIYTSGELDYSFWSRLKLASKQANAMKKLRDLYQLKFVLMAIKKVNCEELKLEESISTVERGDVKDLEGSGDHIEEASKKSNAE